MLFAETDATLVAAVGRLEAAAGAGAEGVLSEDEEKEIVVGTAGSDEPRAPRTAPRATAGAPSSTSGAPRRRLFSMPSKAPPAIRARPAVVNVEDGVFKIFTMIGRRKGAGSMTRGATTFSKRSLLASANGITFNWSAGVKVKVI